MLYSIRRRLQICLDGIKDHGTPIRTVAVELAHEIDCPRINSGLENLLLGIDPETRVLGCGGLTYFPNSFGNRLWDWMALRESIEGNWTGTGESMC